MGSPMEDQLNLGDIDGDEIQEIYISTESGKTVGWNMIVYKNDQINIVYSNYDENNLERDNYEVTLLDDYYFEIKSVDGSYEEKISLMDDLGYQKNELENDGKTRDSSLDDKSKCFKDGKVMEELNHAWIHFLEAETWTDDNAQYEYFKDVNIDGIMLPLNLEFAWKYIGELQINLKYDKSTESLYIDSQKFVKKTEE